MIFNEEHFGFSNMLNLKGSELELQNQTAATSSVLNFAKLMS